MSYSDKSISLTEAQIERLVKQGVHETLISLGIEPDQVTDMQRDFIFLRELRQTHERVKQKGILTLTGIVVAGLVTMIVLGVKSYLT